MTMIMGAMGSELGSSELW